MKNVVLVAAFILTGCGGNSDDSDAAMLTQADYDAIERRCAGGGGVAALLRVIPSIGRSGAVIDVCLEARCANGSIVRGPLRLE